MRGGDLGRTSASLPFQPSAMASAAGKPPVLILRRLDAPFAAALRERFRVLDFYASDEPLPAFLAAVAASPEPPRAAVVLGGGSVRVDASFLDAVPSLRCVFSTGVGIDHIDLAECARRGVAVANIGGIYSTDVADHAVGMLIDVLRRVSAAERYVRRGLWPVQGDYPLGSKRERRVMEGREDDKKGSAAAGSSTPGVRFKNLVSREYYNHKKKVHSVAWNCIGTKLASGSIDHTARVWSIDPHGHSKVKDIELKGHSDSVDQLCWDPRHPDTVATAAADKTIRLWDARSGKCQVVELSGENINITYKPDGTHIAVGNKEDELTIVDVRKLKPIHKQKFPYEINEIAWNKTGDLFFITTGLGFVEVVSYPSIDVVCKLNAHTAGCYCIAMDPLDRYFAVGSADSLVSLWNVKELLCIKTFTKLEWPVRTVSFSHTGEFIAYASEDPFIDIANVQTGRSIHQIPCKAAMNSVEWNPKYNLLAYAGDDKNKYQADEGVFRIFGFESA